MANAFQMMLVIIEAPTVGPSDALKASSMMPSAFAAARQQAGDEGPHTFCQIVYAFLDGRWGSPGFRSWVWRVWK